VLGSLPLTLNVLGSVKQPQGGQQGCPTPSTATPCMLPAAAWPCCPTHLQLEGAVLIAVAELGEGHLQGLPRGVEVVVHHLGGGARIEGSTRARERGVGIEAGTHRSVAAACLQEVQASPPLRAINNTTSADSGNHPPSLLHISSSPQAQPPPHSPLFSARAPRRRPPSPC